MLGGLFKAVTHALKSVGRSALSSLGRRAVGVAKDVMGGKSFKDSALDNLKEAGGEILDDTVQSFTKKRKSTRKSGQSGKRRKFIV